MFLCSIQAATVAFAIWMEWDMSQVPHPDRMPGLMIGAGVFFALVFTLIFLMFEQAIADIRRRLKPVSREPVIPELLEDGVLSRRVLSDRIPRIGK